MFDNVAGLKPYFEPRSIAIIGISRKVGPPHNNAVENLLNYGYTGKIYPVNPNAGDILGVRAYPSIKDVDGQVDLAVLVTPRSQVPMHLRDCAGKGIKCISIVTQGFADSGDEEGRRLDREIMDVAAATGCRILGPNSFGSANAFFNFSSSFAKLNLQRNPVGMVCQSGGLFNGVSEYNFVGKAIDVGNICNIDFSDCLEYFENDPEIKVVVLHIEGMTDVSRFLALARRVTRKKPIIAIKTGKSEQAVRAAQSHTGSLAGNNEIWAAALKQAGVIIVDSLEEMVDMARTFTMLPPVRKPNICVATFSGGAAIMALDGLRNSKLRAAELSERTISELRKIAPPWLPIGNPVDYWPMVMGADDLQGRMKSIFDILLSDDRFGALLIIQIINDNAQDEMISSLLRAVVAGHPGKPVVAALVGEGSFDCIRGLQRDGSVLAFASPERAARALSRRYAYAAYG